MIKGAIYENINVNHTYLEKTFEVINNKQKEYNWLITDIEYFPMNKSTITLMDKEYVWISGEDLTSMIKDEEFLITWGVFTGFKKDIKFEDIMKYELPYANGYGGFWEEKISIQNPLADIELVAWDGLLILFISKDEDLVKEFKNGLSKSQDLLEYNSK